MRKRVVLYPARRGKDSWLGWRRRAGGRRASGLGRFLAGFVLVCLTGGLALGAQRVPVRFRKPKPRLYLVEAPNSAKTSSEGGAAWIRAWPATGDSNWVELGSRLILKLKPGAKLGVVLKGRSLRLARVADTNLYLLQAPDAWSAAQEGARLGSLPGVAVCYPVTRRPMVLDSAEAAFPNDPYYTNQWYLENRDFQTGASLGPDLNVREAWAVTEGQGVIIAIADDGIELSHPDLAPQAAEGLQYDFSNGDTNGLPKQLYDDHGTAVAGLAAAAGYNGIGICGVAPKAQLASWVIFDQYENVVSDEALFDMFQYASNRVSVQNHSWGNSGVTQVERGVLEDAAIDHAVNLGRGGKGEVIVRSGGNGRSLGGNANDDGFLADPRVIAVAAIRMDGKVARYSSPGANILVAAPGGDDSSTFDPCFSNSPKLWTTDRQGTNGYNQIIFPSEPALADYAFGVFGFSGTSASAPQISGLAALIVAANTNLTYRDVQQILVLSSRQVDLNDPDMVTNAAGLKVNHNEGFGLPDAGEAIRLARHWVNRPPATNITYTATNVVPIPDLGVRLLVLGTNVPSDLASIPALPGAGIQADNGTPPLPLVDVGLATNPISLDLRGKVAFIERGTNYFCEKLANAAAAGASLAVVYNNRDADIRVVMGETWGDAVPGVFISQNDGEALRSLMRAQPDLRVQLQVKSAVYNFPVTQTLICEQVGLRVQTDHSSRKDLRITLISPQGTRSILQNLNGDDSPGPSDWTYYTTHDFFESSAGTWTAAVTDENTNGTGSVTGMQLILKGVPIVDSDHDGLDDRWEMAYFNTLNYGPKDDPDGDGFDNAREQIMHTDPTRVDRAPQLNLSRFKGDLLRLSWFGLTNQTYDLVAATNLSDLVSGTPPTPGGSPYPVASRISAGFPVTEWFFSPTNVTGEYIKLTGASGP